MRSRLTLRPTGGRHLARLTAIRIFKASDDAHVHALSLRPARYAGQEFLTEQEAAELSALLTQDDVDPLTAGIFGASDEDRRKRVVQNDPTHYDNALWLATI